MPKNKDKAHDVDVLIAGAGPTGLMAALLLQRCGVKVRITDKNTQQAHESRAFAIQARTLEIFQSIGIVDKFLQHGMAAPGVQLYIDGKKAAQINLNDIGTTDSPYAFVLMLPQSEIESLLIKELEKHDIKVEHNVELINFTQDQYGVTATIKDEKQHTQKIHTQYLIGADGAHSVVRKVLGLTFEGGAYPQNFMLADCNIDWPLDYEFIKVFLHGNSFAAYLPLKGEKLSRIIAAEPYKAANENPGNDPLVINNDEFTFSDIEKCFAKVVGPEVKLSNPVWTTRYHIHHRGVNKYSEGRVFVAGDAAHIHSPAGGQGMNTGLQDVTNLVWKLAVRLQGHSSDQLLDTYNAERRPIGQKLLNFTDKFFERIVTQTEWQTKLRNIIMPLVIKLVSKSKFLKTKVFRFVSELGIRYHDNEFLRNDGPAIQPCAGQRAPNATYKRNHDVFELINGYQFHILALSKKALSTKEIDELHQQLTQLPQNLGLPVKTHFIAHSLLGENKKIIQAQSNQVFENYGLTDKYPFGLFLIRPDGYIAYRSNEINVQKLNTFCGFFAQKSS